MDDCNLIEAYAQDGSESAFTELTRRYEGLVFSAALRHVGDADLARDVVQNVFLCVARKAEALSGEPLLAGWLGRTARFEALKLLRDRRRRSERERVFADGSAETVAGMVEIAGAGLGEDDGVGAEVEAALRGLAAEDHRALVLRYQDGKSLKEIADVLGISEDAAQKRVSRALKRLRGMLGRRGVSCSTAEMSALLGGVALAGSGAVGVAAAAGMGAGIAGIGAVELGVAAQTGTAVNAASGVAGSVAGVATAASVPVSTPVVATAAGASFLLHSSSWQNSKSL